MAQIRVGNNLQELAVKTFVSSPATTAGTSIAVANTNSFIANWAIQIGNTGEEQAEVQTINNISGLALRTNAGLTFDHPTDTPIYAIRYDQVIFKRSTSGTAGTATPLSNGTVTYQPDQLFTQLEDINAQSGYAYKASFRNSIDAEETADSDWLDFTGYSFYSRSKIRDRVKGKLYDSGFIKDDETINDWINEWLENMNNAAVHVNQDYSLGTVDVSFGTAGLGTITATDYKDIRRLWFTTDAVNFYVAQRISQTDFDPQQVFSASAPAYYPYGDNVFGVKPDGSVGTARISYYTLPVVMNDDGDELPVVMRGYSKSFVDYGLSQALQVDGKPGEAEKKMRDAENALSLFVSDITPRSNSGPRFIKITDDVSGENEDN